jgi:hypothetical protein
LEDIKLEGIREVKIILLGSFGGYGIGGDPWE